MILKGIFTVAQAIDKGITFTNLSARRYYNIKYDFF